MKTVCDSRFAEEKVQLIEKYKHRGTAERTDLI